MWPQLRTMLILCCICSSGAAKRYYTIDVNSVTVVRHNSDIVSNISVTIRKLRQMSAIDISFDLLQDVNKFDIHIVLNMLRKDMSKIKMMNIDVDGCNALAHVSDNRLVRPIMLALLAVSNVPHQCPLTAQHYVISNMTLDSENFMPTVPLMNFTLTFIMNTAEIRVLEFEVNGAVRKR